MFRQLIYVLLFSSLAGMFLACTARKEPAGLIKPAYFDLETVIEKQVKLLTHEKAGVEKLNLADGVQQEKKIISNINWEREMETFRQAAINRPAWRVDFTADSSTTPSGNKVVIYRKVPESNAPVEYLQINFSQENKPQNVSARLSTDNMLFTTSKVLEMEFDTSGAQKLRHYSVKGSEKMIFSDPVNYTLKATVLP